MTASSPNSSATPNAPQPAASLYQDHKRPLQRALKYALAALALVSVISALGWVWAQGIPGLWGVLIGVAIGGGYVLLTSLSVLLTANTSAGFTGAVILGGWVVKLALVLMIFAVLDPLDFYHRGAFVITVLLAMAVAIAAEVWGVVTTNTTYVNPTEANEARGRAK